MPTLAEQVKAHQAVERLGGALRNIRNTAAALSTDAATYSAERVLAKQVPALVAMIDGAITLGTDNAAALVALGVSDLADRRNDLQAARDALSGADASNIVTRLNLIVSRMPEI